MLIAVLSVIAWGAVAAAVLTTNTPATGLALAAVLVLTVITMTG
jgi:hypothetical protein